MPTKRTRSTNTLDKPEVADTVSVNVPLPKDLHRQLRFRAIDLEIPLAEAVARALECWLQD
jgi:hypothetical protein